MNNGPNIGHRDDPRVMATELRWSMEIAAASDRFRKAAAYFVGLERAVLAAEQHRRAAGWGHDGHSPEKSALATASSRYRERFGEIGEVDVRNYAAWTLAGKPKHWTPIFAVGTPAVGRAKELSDVPANQTQHP